MTHTVTRSHRSYAKINAVVVTSLHASGCVQGGPEKSGTYLLYIAQLWFYLCRFSRLRTGDKESIFFAFFDILSATSFMACLSPFDL